MSRYVKSSRADQQRNASKPVKASVKTASEQPSVAMLASLGIKVRDFAYESKLPPIQPIYRHPRQIQPAVVRTTLKRQWTELGEDDPFSQSNSQSETSQKKLERTSTEPVIPPVPRPFVRMLGSTNIDDYEHNSFGINSQQSNIDPESQQIQPSIFESQESEPYVDTPPVTPKGSLQWLVLDTPASQSDTESKITAPVPMPHSPLRFSVSPRRPAIPSLSSPLTSALSLARIDGGVSLSKTITSTPPRLSHEKSTADLDQRPVDSTHGAQAPTTPRVLAMRYHLRKRSAPPSSTFSPTKPSSRLYSLRPRGPVVSPSRPHCASIQSSHSRAKPKGESGSKTTLLRPRSSK